MHPREFFASPLNTPRHTITLQRHTKKLKPSQASLLYLLPTVIPTDIEIWLSGLEHRDNFKPIILRINTMYNSIPFTIPHDLWTPYHNFGVFCWCNEEQ